MVVFPVVEVLKNCILRLYFVLGIWIFFLKGAVTMGGTAYNCILHNYITSQLSLAFASSSPFPINQSTTETEVKSDASQKMQRSLKVSQDGVKGGSCHCVNCCHRQENPSTGFMKWRWGRRLLRRVKLLTVEQLDSYSRCIVIISNCDFRRRVPMPTSVFHLSLLSRVLEREVIWLLFCVAYWLYPTRLVHF